MTDETPKVWDNGTAPHASLAEALAAFQAELPKLVKDEKAKVKGETKDGRAYDRSYGYADLAQVVETVLPVLGKHGLSVTSRTVFIEGRFMLEVSLLHESSEHRDGYWPLPDPSRSGPQDIGSAMTYGRRYLTLALSGAYPGGEDDDGAKAQQSARESWDTAQPQRPTTGQAFDQHARGTNVADEPRPPKKEWSDEEVLDQIGRLSTLDLEKAGKLYDWMGQRGLHNRVVQDVTGTQALAFRLADTTLENPTLPQLDAIRDFADGRGLLKVAVTETESLDQVIVESRARKVRQLEEIEAAKAQAKQAIADREVAKATPENYASAD